jgi:very-short-patch-repair endonuclease
VFEVVTTRWDRVRRPDVTVHESLDLIAEDVIELDGLAVTAPARTVVDLGASNRWLVESALEQGIRADRFTLGEVEAFMHRVARRGRRGVGVIRPLLEARRRWDTVTESALEDEFRKLIVEGELPDPVPQFVVHDDSGRFVCRADFAYPSARLLIELDSEAHHMDRLSFRRDRSKQNRSAVLGWTTLRYTWWDLQDEPWRVWNEIRSALNSASTG